MRTRSAYANGSLKHEGKQRMSNSSTDRSSIAGCRHSLFAAGLDGRARLLHELGQGAVGAVKTRDEALELLLWWLAQRDVQPNARQDLAATFAALGELGDARAAPTLRALARSVEPSGLHDERGFPVPLGQLASDTLRRLQRQCGTLQDLPSAPAGVSAVPSPHELQATQRPSPSAGTSHRLELPARQGHLQRLLRWPHLPLVLGLAAPAWAFVVVVAAVDAKGYLTPSPAGRHALALLAVLPAAVGLFVAARQLLAGVAASSAQRVSLACGTLLSALVLRVFWSDLF